MQMFELVILICFAVMALDLLYVVTKILCLKRADRIEFVRSFKKGRCSFIYFVAFPLFLCGRLYTGQEFLKAIFSSIHYIVKLVILQYDITPIEALMNDSALYANAIYFCYTLVAFNVILFALSIFNQKIWYGFRTIFFRFRRKEKYILLGSNKENLSIFRSTPPHSAQIVDLLTDEQCNTYYMEDVAYHDLKVWDDLVDYVSRQHRKRDDAKLYIIVNSGSEEQNVLFCQRLVGYIQSLDHPDLLFGLEIYVFGDARYEGLYEDLMKQAKGCLHYLNKYQKVAVDMIDRFPFTRFMDDRHIDFNTSLVCGEVDINVALIGFGNTNRQIFLTSVANNQFITQGEDGEPHIKPVHYHIIDRQDAHSNKNLNHSYYRFTHEFSTIQNREDEYLPFPDLPAAEHYYQMDINELSFYSSIRRVFSRHPLDVNFIVVAFGSDLENMDMAKKLIEKRNEWKLPHLVIFVKIRSRALKSELEHAFMQEGCYIIGCEEEVVFQAEHIVSAKLDNMAKMRNEVYDIEYDLTHTEDFTLTDEYIETSKRNSLRRWYEKKTQLERESSLYACLSLRSKLHMMGLDYAPLSDTRPAIEKDEYLALYAKEDKPNFAYYQKQIEGKEVVFYGLDFPPSRRKNLAIHEHYRWNSFMMSHGIVPATIEQILEEKDQNGNYTNGKNYRLRRHGNLTTFEGLVTFRQIVAKARNIPEAQADVIKYDYQLLDDAHWLLAQNGYKIVKKSPSADTWKV